MLSHKVELVSYVIFSMIIAIFLGFAFVLENPYVSRGGKLLGLSVVFLVLVVCAFIIRHRKPFIATTVMALTTILIILEYNSKFSMNYLYHVLYFMIVLIVVAYIEYKEGIILASIVTLASYIKFIQLISIEMNQVNISNFVFYAVIQILLITTIFIAKAYYSKSIKTKDLYRQLLDAYQKLDVYSHGIKILSAKEERTSIARDLHDTLGHELTGLIMQLELSKYNIDEGNDTLAHQYLDEGISNARNSLTRVREIVDTLKNSEKVVFAIQSLVELTSEFTKRTNIEVELNLNDDKTIAPEQLLILYRIIQEALTNTAKHSQSDIVKINISHLEEGISFTIEDMITKKSIFNKTKKIQKITKGNGLIGMEERISEVNGTISFYKYSGSNVCFLIEGIIPKRMGKE